MFLTTKKSQQRSLVVFLADPGALSRCDRSLDKTSLSAVRCTLRSHRVGVQRSRAQARDGAAAKGTRWNPGGKDKPASEDLGVGACSCSILQQVPYYLSPPGIFRGC